MGKQNEDWMMEELRNLIMGKERKELDSLNHVLSSKPEMATKVNPVIEDRLVEFSKQLPLSYDIAIRQIIREEMHNSKDEIINAVYPELGRLVKLYIRFQFEQLQSYVDDRIYKALHTGLLGKINRIFYPKSIPSKIPFFEEVETIVQEVFLLEKHSGLLLGSASSGQGLDLDIVGGMLTAIKSFVEEAFNSGKQRLESINYDDFCVVFQELPNAFIAVVVNKSIGERHADFLRDRMLTFASKEFSKIDLKAPDVSLVLQQKLSTYFIDAQIAT